MKRHIAQVIGQFVGCLTLLFVLLHFLAVEARAFPSPTLTNQTARLPSLRASSPENSRLAAAMETLLTNETVLGDTPLVASQSAAARLAGRATSRAISSLNLARGSGSPGALTRTLNPPIGPLASLVANAPLLNIDFAFEGVEEIGFAAIGQTTEDFWNLYAMPGYDAGTLTDLAWSDGTPSTVAVTVENAPGVWAMSCCGAPMPDPMYDVYVYPWDGGNITVTLSSLPPGTYDFYLYIHDGTWAELYSNGLSLGSKGTAIGGTAWATANWSPGQQFVSFRNVTVTENQPVVAVVMPGCK